MMALLIAFALGCEVPQSSETNAQAPEEVALAEVLQRWENATAGTKRLEVVFDQYQYNDVFRTEKRGKGTLTYTAPDQATLRIEPGNLKSSCKAGWTLEPLVSELFEWNSSEFRTSSSGGKTESLKLPLPRAHDEKPSLLSEFIESWRQFAETPGGHLRPFLAHFDADGMKTRYRIRITQRKENEIWLEFIPRRPVDLASFKKLDCILDAQSFQPKAMRMQEPGEGSYCVYVFKEIKAN